MPGVPEAAFRRSQQGAGRVKFSVLVRIQNKTEEQAGVHATLAAGIIVRSIALLSVGPTASRQCAAGLSQHSISIAASIKFRQ